MPKNYILDTNVLLSNHDCILSGFDENNLSIPLAVIEELDRIKVEKTERGYSARKVIRDIESCRVEGDRSIYQGVSRNDQGGVLKIISINKKEIEDLNVGDFDISIPDNLIILSAYKIFKKDPNTVFVSNDCNARIKASLMDIPTELYRDTSVGDSTFSYTGYRTIEMELGFFGVFIGDDWTPIESTEFIRDQEFIKTHSPQPNEFILFEPDTPAKALLTKEQLKNIRVVYRFMKGTLVRRDLKDTLYGNVKGNNLEQSCAIDLLMDDDVPIVSIKSRAGSGKTFLSVAASLTKLFSKKNNYDKIIFLKPTVSVHSEIGYLKGDANDKIRPFMGSFIDNLTILHKRHSDKHKEFKDFSFEKMVKDGLIETECISFLRGRSLNDCIIIADEIQNIDKNVLKTIITRVGHNCKIICIGDVEQIDASYLSKRNNGLAHLINKFIGQEVYGHITLQKHERSKVSDIAGKLL